MFAKRWIGIAIAALLLIVVISASGGSAQRNAWMQGYLAGRLSTGTGDAAALAPYMIPGSPYMPGYGGFGHGAGLFIGLGLLALGFLLIRGRAHHGRWREGKEDWAERMHQEMRRWRDRPGGPPNEEQRIV